MTNNSRTYECSTKLPLNVTTGMVSQMAFVGRSFFSLVTNSNLRLKVNICILTLLILFSKDLLLLCYIQVFEENQSFSCISLFYFTLNMYLNKSIFFPRTEKVTFSNQVNLYLIFWSFFTHKTKLFNRFY